MGLYNIINPTTMQGGQPEDVGQVLANFQAVQAILNGGIDNTNLANGILASKLAGYPASAGSVLAGDGTWKTVPKVTTSTFAGGPPGAPTDGDIWIATAVDTVGTRWAFQYNAGSASAFKWEFIGGPPTYLGGGGGAIVSTVYVDLPTPVSIPLARGGDYVTRFGGHNYNSGTSGSVFLGIVRGTNPAADITAASIENPPAINNPISIVNEVQALALAAAATVKLQGRVVSGTGQFGQCYIAITPVRVA